jgi:hypothetical protein
MSMEECKQRLIEKRQNCLLLSLREKIGTRSMNQPYETKDDSCQGAFILRMLPNLNVSSTLHSGIVYVKLYFFRKSVYV